MILRIALKTILLDKAISAFFNKIIHNFNNRHLLKLKNSELRKGMVFKKITHTLANTTYFNCTIIKISQYNNKADSLDVYFKFDKMSGDLSFAYAIWDKVEAIYFDEADQWIFEQ